MSTGQIKFIIDKTGKVKSEVYGVSGTSCTDLTRAFTSMGHVTSDEMKMEYYETPRKEELCQEQ